MYIEALARLNHMLQQAGTEVTVIAFLILPAPTDNFNVESLRGQAITKRIADTVADIQKKVADRMFEQVRPCLP